MEFLKGRFLRRMLHSTAKFECIPQLVWFLVWYTLWKKHRDVSTPPQSLDRQSWSSWIYPLNISFSHFSLLKKGVPILSLTIKLSHTIGYRKKKKKKKNRKIHTAILNMPWCIWKQLLETFKLIEIRSLMMGTIYFLCPPTNYCGPIEFIFCQCGNGLHHILTMCFGSS